MLNLVNLQLMAKNTLPCVQPFHALIYPLSLAEMLQIAKRYAQRAKLNVALCENNFKYRTKGKGMRLKVGYVSSNFNNHPISLFTQSIFGMHDRTKIEVFCYALTKSDGSESRLKIEKEAEHFRDVTNLHAIEIAQLIHSDNIHVLINMNGYIKGARNEIFALKPAPVQVISSFVPLSSSFVNEYRRFHF